MITHSMARPLTYLLLITGSMLAFVAAMVPHYDAGYRLVVSVLLTGLLPYLVYAMVLPYLRGWLLALPALVMVLVHGWVVAIERFIDFQGYNNGSIFYVPLVLSGLGLLLLAWAVHTHPCGRD